MNVTTDAEAAMSPGAYLRRRREAAGLSIEAAAALLAADPQNQPPPSTGGGWAEKLTALEGDQVEDPCAVDQLVLIGRLELVFRFDRFVYFALVARQSNPEAPVPDVCRACACSWNDACVDRTGPCAWANAGTGEPLICNHCDRDGLDPLAARAPVPANDREASNAA